VAHQQPPCLAASVRTDVSCLSPRAEFYSIRLIHCEVGLLSTQSGLATDFLRRLWTISWLAFWGRASQLPYLTLGKVTLQRTILQPIFPECLRRTADSTKATLSSPPSSHVSQTPSPYRPLPHPRHTHPNSVPVPTLFPTLRSSS
jgi:hypothetical protein